jgi:signal transduction histidine kinase
MNVLSGERKSGWLLAGIVAYIVVVFVVDCLTPPLVDVWVLYLPLILLLTRLNALQQIIGVAIACTILMATEILLTQYEVGMALILVILGTRLTALWLVALSGTIIVRNILRRKELERQVLEAAASEQQRIGQELHDSVGQELTALGLMFNALAERSHPSGEESQIINRLTDGLVSVQQHVRSLSHGLIPVPVEAKGLHTALEDLANDTARMSGISVRFSSPERFAVSNYATATHLYRIAQEAVNNALRHAAPQQISLTLHNDTNGLSINIEDDGSGIQYPLDAGKGMGLRIMQYRAEQIGGLLRIRRREAGGTIVTCALMPNSLKDFQDDQSAVPAIEGEDLDR